MCFIKTVYNPINHHKSFITPIQSQTFRFPSPKEHETLTQIQELSHPEKKNSLFCNSNSSLFLLQLATKLHKNQQEMNFIHNTIDDCEETLDDLMLELNSEQSHEVITPTKKNLDIQTFVSFSEQHSTSPQLREQPSSNILTKQLFGDNKKYRYKIQTVEEFDNVIFKERNIKLNVQLKSLDGKAVKNSNMVNLCLALADDNGNWVSLNRVGDPMLKGKTEVELYHGSAEFNKIYTRDISRTFPNGRLNLIVYAKPSMLIYDGLTTEFEEHVDEGMIEPLVIEDVVIKAKKKY